MRNGLRNLTVVFFTALHHLINFKTAAIVQVVSFNYNLFTYACAMIYFVLTAF